MKITLVSPYHGGSHQAWAKGYQRHSRHEVTLLTLPARFWKWRMHGGAVTLARQFLADSARPGLILATDMLDLTTFLALTRTGAPAVLYMHENQLTYPLPGRGSPGPMRRQKGERDLHYAFVNYASMLAADAVCFNSHYHRRSFFAALPNFLKHFPEYNELSTIAQLRGKSEVLPVGIELAALGTVAGGGWQVASDERQGETPPHSQPTHPLILWNQRWEYDKNPAGFFRALYAIAEAGIPFRLAVCGENFRRRPEEFDEAAERLSEQIIHFGYANRERYRELLWAADVTVSTAHHEFFGISILEAIACHTFPILPHRLSYPELLPEQWHGDCLYDDEAGLRQRLRWALTHRAEAAAIAAELAPAGARFAWSQVASRYDTFFDRIASKSEADDDI